LGPRPPSLVRVRAYSIPYLTCEAVVARAVWQAPNASNDPPNRTDGSEPPGKTAARVSTEPSAEAPQASRQARRRARLRRSAEALQASRRVRRRAHLEPSAEAVHERAVWQAAGPVSKHALPREPPRTPRRPPSDPSSKPLPRSRVRSGAQAAAGGRRRYRTEPLGLLAVNPLTVGDFGSTVIWGFIHV